MPTTNTHPSNSKNPEKELTSNGFELFNNQRFKEAIAAFKFSLTIKEDWKTYQALGWALFNTEQNDEAIDAFHKSLTLNENWSSFQGLGLTLVNNSNPIEAITMLRRSISIKETWESYQALGLALFNTKNYQESIDAFKKSLVLKEDWRTFNGLGWALFKNKNHKESIDSFEKALDILEEWNSYQGLGWALLNTKNSKKAIEAFNKSITLKEDWSSLQGLGWALINSKQNTKAIEAFQASLTLREHWNSFHGLAWAFLNTNKNEKAIDAFSKSLTLKEDWSSFQGLGWAFTNAGRHHKAIEAFEKSISIKSDWNTYFSIALIKIKQNEFKEAVEAHIKSVELNKNESLYLDSFYTEVANQFEDLGKENSARRCWEIYYANQLPYAKINPFLNEKPIYQTIELEDLNEIKSHCHSNGFVFQPSYANNDLYELANWRNMMYLHIPKCGGTSFKIPLLMLYHLLSNSKLKSNDNYINCLVTGNIGSKSQEEALKKSITRNKYKSLDNIFFTSYTENWEELYRHVSQESHKNPRIIATIRNPRERLLSHLKMVAENCQTKDELIEIINKYKNEYDNCIYRYLFTGKAKDQKKYLKGPNYDLIKDIDFVDISDHETISKLKSAFLSASKLPNIVQYSKLNDSKNRLTRIENKIPYKEIEQVYHYCIKHNFVEKDESINYDYLKSTTKKRLNLPYFEKSKTCKVHPLTFIIKSEKEYEIIPTHEFLKCPSISLEKDYT